MIEDQFLEDKKRLQRLTNALFCVPNSYLSSPFQLMREFEEKIHQIRSILGKELPNIENPLRSCGDITRINKVKELLLEGNFEDAEYMAYFGKLPPMRKDLVNE